jgi:ABC-type glycerol-3-phosphate transport system substrate-binding protein
MHRRRVSRTPADAKQTPQELFPLGRLAMEPFRPAQLGNYRRQLQFPWGLTPAPKGPKGKAHTTIMVGSAWFMPADGKLKEEAWELLQHLTSAEAERAQIKHSGNTPARKAVMDEYVREQPPKNMGMLTKAAEQAYRVPTTPWFPEADATLTGIMNDLWEGRTNAGAAAQEAKRLLDPLLQQPFSFKAN